MQKPSSGAHRCASATGFPWSPLVASGRAEPLPAICAVHQAHAKLGDDESAERDAEAAAALRPADKAIQAHRASFGPPAASAPAPAPEPAPENEPETAAEVAAGPSPLVMAEPVRQGAGPAEAGKEAGPSSSSTRGGARMRMAARAAAEELLELSGGDFSAAVEALLAVHRARDGGGGGAMTLNS